MEYDFVDQTVLHDPENGKYGDCLNAVLATMLQIPIEDVPITPGETSNWERELNEWLEPLGLAYIQVSWPDDTKMREHFAMTGVVGCPMEICGVSPRFPGTLHACFGIDGTIVHDPHPSRAGIAGNANAVGLLVSLRPDTVVATEIMLGKISSAIHDLRAVLCDYDGVVCIAGSDGDRQAITESLEALQSAVDTYSNGDEL